jgi:AraC-like DNA-binding protein
MIEIVNNTKTKILKEQFIPDNVFMYILRGEISFFDGNKSYTFRQGECGIGRKKCLAKYLISDSYETFEPILFCFDTPFVQQFQKKYKHAQPEKYKHDDAFIRIQQTARIDDFIQSIKPYYKGVMQLDEAFEDLKYEELLIILLQNEPELASVFFDYAIPEKINLEAFMNRNFRFNVSVVRFAYLTGRSLSAFKRDFNQIFNDTPNHWLVQRRLQEAYFLIEKKNQKPSDIYLELGFETLSHFSFAFKKQFGLTPTELNINTSR